MIIGNLGQGPEIRYTPSGLPVANFLVATDEAYRDKEGQRQQRAEWDRIVVIGRLAMTCNAYLKKGREVFVEGRLRTREWENNGSNVRRTEIVATRVQFLGALRDTKVEEPAKDPDLIDDPDVSL